MKEFNAGYMFYNEYYRNLSDEDWLKVIKKEEKLSEDEKKKLSEKINNQHLLEQISFTGLSNIKTNATFSLKTAYPGLLIGSGYTHGAGNINNEFKIGFYFDHTSGLPTIPGSSLKGMLRSVFPSWEYDKEGVKTSKKINAQEREDYIRKIIRDECGKDGIDIEKLETVIFDGIKNAKAEKNKDKYLTAYDRDVFFDAQLSDSNSGKNIFGEDFITPHKNKDKNHALDEFSNPNPIMFFKILPNIKIDFYFDLKDWKSADGKTVIFSKAEKEKLFLEIIKDLGIGAKTAVGYGYLEEVPTKTP